jgi:hypothetical protein
VSEEKELLRGKTASVFHKQPIVLTTKHLIIGERSIALDDILEVYAEQGRLDSKMVVRLRNGAIEECKICPEKTVSALTFLGGSLGDQESEMRANYKATTDRWVNLINRLLK